jgi:hypothetical protein
MNRWRTISKEVIRYGSIFEHGTFPNEIENNGTICDKILLSGIVSHKGSNILKGG